jgi:hypothetical protein
MNGKSDSYNIRKYLKWKREGRVAEYGLKHTIRGREGSKYPPRVQIPLLPPKNS